jgi:hypothetical protein
LAVRENAVATPNSGAVEVKESTEASQWKKREKGRILISGKIGLAMGTLLFADLFLVSTNDLFRDEIRDLGRGLVFDDDVDIMELNFQPWEERRLWSAKQKLTGQGRTWHEWMHMYRIWRQGTIVSTRTFVARCIGVEISLTLMQEAGWSSAVHAMTCMEVTSTNFRVNLHGRSLPFSFARLPREPKKAGDLEDVKKLEHWEGRIPLQSCSSCYAGLCYRA